MIVLRENQENHIATNGKKIIGNHLTENGYSEQEKRKIKDTSVENTKGSQKKTHE
jgi:hypothetical protein